MAVWLAHDKYDYVDQPNYISATGLLGSVRMLLLSKRVPAEQRSADISTFAPSALGTAAHDAVELAWTTHYVQSLRKLGYTDTQIARVRINPTEEEVAATPNCLPIYLEQRAFKEFKGHTIGGKFDFVLDGMVQDLKTTSTYSWGKDQKANDYILQGSIYRWLNPEKITQDTMQVNFYFTDWKAGIYERDSSYPPGRCASKTFPLMPLKETEAFIQNKLQALHKYANAPEAELPECTDADLWRDAPTHKYYSNPANTEGRCTKRFDELSEAQKYLTEKGKGVVITVPGKPRRCDFCNASPICSQYARMKDD
jgi:hypothetical protein